MALNIYRSLILQIGDFLCLAGTNFCDWLKLFFLAQNKFLELARSHV